MLEDNNKQEPLIGIDLGTTNSLIAVWRDGKAELIPNALGDVLTPSIISIDADDSILVGKAARSRLTTHPERTAAAFKRYMGTDKRISLGARSFSPEELSALVLGALKADAEAFLGTPVTDVVISVPAYFSDEQRKRTAFAAELAGMRVQRLINEPTAAAMAYGLHDQDFQRTLIFDLGGGTFDVTVLEYSLPLIEVHASTGDNFLGGEDFTAALVDACLKDWQLSRDALDVQSMAQLEEAIEQLKQRLGSTPQSLHCLQREWTLDESRAARIWESLLARLRRPIEQALRDARLSPKDIDNLVLVGGATRMGAVQQMVAMLFGRLPYRHIDPDTVVALGAAAMAASKARDKAIEEIIMTDVCPYTLGISSQDGDKVKGIFSPIIERNTVIPTSREQRFYSTHEGQKQVTIEVYQGERPWVRDNIHVQSFDVDLPEGDGIKSLDVRFSYDINGLLEVDVTFPGSDRRYTRVIDRSPTGMSEEARRESHARLASLKIHPRDTLANRTLLARLETAWAQALGDEREQLRQWLSAFTLALEQQHTGRINDLRRQLNSQLDQLGF